MRKRSNHCRRLPVLVDAQAVIGSAAKGRTSAPTTKRQIRHLGAMVVAGALLLRLIYIPSEDNPADASSRGVRRSIHRRRGAARPLRCSKYDCTDRLLRSMPHDSVEDERCSKCPGCGALPAEHPRHVAKHLRGTGLFCRTPGRFHYAYKSGAWIERHHETHDRLREHLGDDPVAASLFQLLRPMMSLLHFLVSPYIHNATLRSTPPTGSLADV